MSFEKFLSVALGGAYPDWESLSLIVRYALDKPLDEITVPKGMESVRFDFIVWARANNRLGEFLRGARKDNLRNEAIRNALWLFNLMPLLEGGENWQAVGNEIYLHLPRSGLGSRRLMGELSLRELAVDLAGERDWKDDTVPHIPLLDFVELLIGRIKAEDGAKAKPLRQWSDQAMADLGWSADDIERLRFGWKRLARRPSAGGLARLLLRVSPVEPPNDKKEKGEDLYAVKAWLADIDEAKPLLGQSERSRRKDELRELIDECRAGLFRAGLRPDQVRLELTLPRALLGEAIDQWVDAEDKKTPLGSLHSLVLRCWERLKKDEWSAALGRCLNDFSSAGRKLIPAWNVDAPPADEPEVVWIDAARSGGPLLRISLQKRAHCCVCVLEKAPLPAAAEPTTDILNTLLRAGIPAVLWARQPPDGKATLQDVFKELFDASVNLENLPEAIYRQRMSAVGCETWHLGQHVALIWDDPRFPPSPEDDYTFRLRSPAL